MAGRLRARSLGGAVPRCGEQAGNRHGAVPARRCPGTVPALSRPGAPPCAGNGRAGITAAPNRRSRGNRTRPQREPGAPLAALGRSQPRGAAVDGALNRESGAASRADPAPQPARVFHVKVKLK